MAYPDLKEVPTLLEIRTKDDEMKTIKHKTEIVITKMFYNHLRLIRIIIIKIFSNDLKKTIYITILEILVGVSGRIVGTSLSITGVGTSIGVPIAGCSSFLASVATLILNEFFSKLKLGYTKLKDWINMITILYEKILNELMIDKRIDEKEGDELNKVYYHYLDKRKDIMKSTEISYHEVFGDVLGQEVFTSKQITKLQFFSQNNVSMNFSININLFNWSKTILKSIQSSAPDCEQFFYCKWIQNNRIE